MLNLKNLRVYRLSRDYKFDTTSLQHQLKAMEFTPCGSQDMAKVGWVAPLGEGAEMLFHAAGKHILLTRCREEKILPREVIQKELSAKVLRLESDQGRKLKKTEKDSLRDEILHTLLPRAFSRQSHNRIWIDTERSLIAVDASSAKKAEDSLALLRKTLGSLPVVPLMPETPVELTLTEWVKKRHAPDMFHLGDSAVLHAMLVDGGKVTCKKHDLECDEVAMHLETGKVVTRLALSWRERIDFILDDSFAFSGLKFADSLRDQNDDIDHEDAAARFDADMTLLTGELAALIGDLVEALGGEMKKTFVETDEEGEYEDSLFADAARFVLDTARPTISAIQRQFRIGYNRAARIIEAMEAKGLLSAPAHDGTRSIIAGAEVLR